MGSNGGEDSYLARAVQEMCMRVHQLYNVAPGSSGQAEANAWLTAFLGSDVAWGVVMHILSSQSPTSDPHLNFMAANMLQLKVQRDWVSAPADVRQAVESLVVGHVQQEAAGACTRESVVSKQLRVAFVNMVVMLLKERFDGGASSSSIIQQICHMLNLEELLLSTAAPSLEAFMSNLTRLELLLDILQTLPANLRREGRWSRDVRDDGPGDWEDSPAYQVLQSLVPHVLVMLRRLLEACHAYANASPAVTSFRSLVLQCLLGWVERDEKVLGLTWVSVGDLAGLGVIHEMEKLLALDPSVVGADALETVLQILAESVSLAAETGAKLERESPSSKDVVAAVSDARAVIDIARLVLSSVRLLLHMEASQDTGVDRAACELVVNLIEQQLPVFWTLEFYQRMRDENGISDSLFHELLSLLVAFTNHADLENVAIPALKLFPQLPEELANNGRTLDERVHVLSQLLPNFLLHVHRQCQGSGWGEEEWALAVSGMAVVKGLRPDAEREQELQERLTYRTDACEALQCFVMALQETRYSESDVYGPADGMTGSTPSDADTLILRLLGSLMSERAVQSDPRAMESVLWLLRACAGCREEEDGDDGHYGAAHTDDTLHPTYQQFIGVLTQLNPLTHPSVAITAFDLLSEIWPVLLRDVPLDTYKPLMERLGAGLSHPLVCITASMAVVTLAESFQTIGSPPPYGQPDVFLQFILSIMSEPAFMTTVKAEPEAYENLWGAVGLFLCLEGPCQALLDQAGQLLHAHIASPDVSPNVSACILTRVMSSCRHASPQHHVADTLLSAAWGAVDASIFAPITSTVSDVNAGAQPHVTEDAVHPPCMVMMTMLEALRDPIQALPALVERLSPLIQHMGGLWGDCVKVLDAAMTMCAGRLCDGPALGDDGDRAYGVSREAWPRMQALFDVVMDAALRSDVRHVERRHFGDEKQGPVAFYMSVMILAENAAEHPTCPYSATQDAHGARRALDLAVRILELAINLPDALRFGPLGYITKLLDRHRGLWPALRDSTRQLVWLCVATPLCSIFGVAEMLHKALYTSGEASAVFQGLLTELLTSESGLRSQYDGRIVDWAARIFTSAPPSHQFYTFVQKFRQVCEGSVPIEEVQGLSSAELSRLGVHARRR